MPREIRTEYEIEIPSAGSPATKPFHLLLTRVRKDSHPLRKPVLLLHGANNSSDAFTVPNGGMAGYLCSAGFDVWLLDWRASRRVLTKRPFSDKSFGSAVEERGAFSFNRIVEQDLTLALTRMRTETAQPISIVGFCVGAAVVSMAVARGELDRFNVDSIVLMTVASFLRGPWDTWMKSREYILEQCIAEEPDCRIIDPHNIDTWPKPLKTAYDRWPEKLRPAGAPKWFQRLAFMYGEPYSRRLVEGVVDDAAAYFGPLHMGIYLDAARLLRRGHAPELDASRSDPLATHAQEQFTSRKVTLIGGAQDRLWHRESLDLMYDWLLRAPNNPATRCKKIILADYAHNDLLWAQQAPQHVFAKVLDGIVDLPAHAIAAE